MVIFILSVGIRFSSFIQILSQKQLSGQTESSYRSMGGLKEWVDGWIAEVDNVFSQK